MTLKEFYDSIGSDFSAALMRMGNSERMLDKFVKKFPNDKTAGELFKSLDEKDYQLAFRMAHTLKGVCANLGLDNLQKASSVLTEALRNDVAENTPELAEIVKTEYEKVISALGKLD